MGIKKNLHTQGTYFLMIVTFPMGIKKIHILTLNLEISLMGKKKSAGSGGMKLKR
jgi:hypothetical protein